MLLFIRRESIMLFGVISETTGLKLVINSTNTFVFVCLIFLLPMSIPTSSAAAAQIVSSPQLESSEIDGIGIINTPNRNITANLRNIPFGGGVSHKMTFSIGRLCDHDSDCGNYSICSLVFSDPETTRKICQCDNREMKQLNHTCYIKPGHQCYFPKKNSHGYAFINCFPGSTCRSAVNTSAPKNGYCMCSSPTSEMRYREVSVDFEMAQCSATIVKGILLHPLAVFLFGFIVISGHRML